MLSHSGLFLPAEAHIYFPIIILARIMLTCVVLVVSCQAQ